MCTAYSPASSRLASLEGLTNVHTYHSRHTPDVAGGPGDNSPDSWRDTPRQFTHAMDQEQEASD